MWPKPEQTLGGRLTGQAWILGRASSDLLSLGQPRRKLISLNAARRELRIHALTSDAHDLRGFPGGIPLSIAAGRSAQPVGAATRQQTEERDL